MNKRLVGLCALCAGLLGLVTAGTVHSQENQMSQPELEMTMEEWMALSQPGDHHKWMQKAVGEWDVTMKIWRGGPDAPPMEAKGSATVKSILDGRFIKEDFRVKMQMPGAPEPMDFHGISMLGYDNYQRMYVGSWCDNMSTSFTSMRGTRKPGSDTLVMYCEMDEPMLGVRGRIMRMVSKVVDKNTHVMQMFDLHAGEDYKVMEITYKRK